MNEIDEFHGQGGSYEIRDGKRVRVEEPTRDHPEGNRPRGVDGKPLDAEAAAAETTAAHRPPNRLVKTL